jgi:hypothetical protein
MPDVWLKISLINVQLVKKMLHINSIVSLMGFISIFFKVLLLQLDPYFGNSLMRQKRVAKIRQ